MDPKIWLWLIIIAISLIARLVKKNGEQRARTIKKSSEGQSASRPSPKSFEELLAEIQGSKAPAALPQARPVSLEQRFPVAPTKYDFVDYDDDAIESSKKKEIAASKYNYRKDDGIYDIYDNAKKQAFERKSLEETMNLADTDIRFGAFRKYERHVTVSVAAEFAREIRTPSGIKKAFIMNEILQRRF